MAGAGNGLGCTPLSFLKASTTDTQSRSHLNTWRSFRRHTVLEHYLFYAKDGDMLLALGLGSLFNHSRRPNLDYRVDGREQARIKDTSMVHNARTCEIGWSFAAWMECEHRAQYTLLVPRCLREHFCGR